MANGSGGGETPVSVSTQESPPWIPPRSVEQRREARTPGQPPLTVLGIAAEVHDISRAGICLRLAPDDSSLAAPGTSIDIHLRDEIDQSAQSLRAEVVWSDGERIGMRWVELSPDHDSWLLNRFQVWLAGLLDDE